jgi:hypothetical protein
MAEVGAIETRVTKAIADLGELSVDREVVAELARHLARALDAGARSQTALVAKQLKEAMDELFSAEPDADAAAGLEIMPLELLQFRRHDWPSFEGWHSARLAWSQSHPNGRPGWLEVLREDYKHPENDMPTIDP